MSPGRLRFFLLALIFSLTFTGCASMQPEPSDDEINAEAAKAYAQVKSKARFSTRRDWNDSVQRVARQIAQSSGENFQWEAILIESPEINAWCMPGGKIAVYTGIMPVLKNEAALAAVLGHEVAHATLRHGKKRYARAVRQNTVGLIIGGATAIGGQLFCKTQNCRLLAGLGGAAASLAVTFFERKFDRQEESDADEQGQIYMAKAGYEPSEAIQLWERMNQAHQGAAPPEWLSTHPSDVTRRANLSAWMPRAKAIYDRAPQRFGLGQPIR